MSGSFASLFLSLIVGWSPFGPAITKSHNENSPISANNSSVVGESSSKTLACDPKGYNVEEFAEPGNHSVKIVSGGTVLHTIRLLSDEELNGFGFNGAKKTKQGFEISISYGSVIYYAKTFTFICRQKKFYLSKIRVESFNKHNPEKWKRKVIRVRPYLRLEKFVIADFV